MLSTLLQRKETENLTECLGEDKEICSTGAYRKRHFDMLSIRCVKPEVEIQKSRLETSLS